MKYGRFPGQGKTVELSKISKKISYVLWSFFNFWRILNHKKLITSLKFIMTNESNFISLRRAPTDTKLRR